MKKYEKNENSCRIAPEHHFYFSGTIDAFFDLAKRRFCAFLWTVSKMIIFVVAVSPAKYTLFIAALLLLCLG